MKHYFNELDYVDLVSEDNVFSGSEEEQLNRALEESLKESSHAAVHVEDILQSLRVGINEEVIRFNLNRRNEWDGAVRRPNFSTNKRVDVKFTDDAGVLEGAVDLGGPMREFFRLVLQHRRNSPMFDGPENQRTLSCHAESLKNNSYFYAGQLIAMSIVHGGPSPHFFAPVLFQGHTVLFY
ncbi:G2/M phase-specific E3 ubiquitin-protein ligase-like [Huso huso]|uniref:G2/M phase-specific E3 ubiquitin-protein ligase-like n=1 Tax=Huso huso TaxID=61971 RepID=A0ABR0YEG6_HUSHU